MFYTTYSCTETEEKRTNAPHFNSINTMTSTEADNLRAYIIILSERGYYSFTPLNYDYLTIILDSGASCCMTPDKSDFIEDTYNVKHREIGGIGTGLTTEGAGKVQWRLTDTKGKEVPIIVECLYVPNLPC